ncbi:MAG: HAD-IIB family hydrolase [Candidatus Poseidoniales archaeon]
MNYIFDVDGTLTPSRGEMDSEFKDWFNKFQDNNITFLVTGSDKFKTVEQIGKQTYNKFIRCYNCQGNEVWEGDVNKKKVNIVLPPQMIEVLETVLSNSVFPLRTGQHIESRSGLVNFSVLGRNANQDERQGYIIFDKRIGERAALARYLNKHFPEYHASVAGETGIDIIVKGQDKSQILSDFKPDDKITFFGDKTKEGGNDYEIAQAVKKHGGHVYNVADWKNTYAILRGLQYMSFLL